MEDGAYSITESTSVLRRKGQLTLRNVIPNMKSYILFYFPSIGDNFVRCDSEIWAYARLTCNFVTMIILSEIKSH